MSITALLDRLDAVRQTGPGRWIARCPGPLHEHGDRRPSLSIRETGDGKLLVRCFAGCDTEAVLQALGLTWAALFPYDPYAPEDCASATIPATDLLEIIDHEVLVAVLILSDIEKSRGVATSGQMERLTRAAARIGKARDMACPLEIKQAKYPRLSGDAGQDARHE
jgi:hypothetical protein